MENAFMDVKGAKDGAEKPKQDKKQNQKLNEKKKLREDENRGVA